MKKENVYSVIEDIVNKPEDGIYLNKADVIVKIEAALKSAAKKNDCKGQVKVVFDEEKRAIKMYAYYYIVNEIVPEGPAQFFKGEVVLIKENEEDTAPTKKGEVVAYSKKVNTKVATEELNEETGELERVEKDYPTILLMREKPLEGQIVVAEAQARWGEKATVGKIVKEELKFNDFTRTAVHTFAQTFMGGIKELKRQKIYEHYVELEGKTLEGMVVKADDNLITFQFDYGNKTEVMPRTQASKNETFEIGKRIKLYVTKVEKTPKGPKIYLSQSNPEIVKQLFEENIPEVKDGSVEIVGQAREAGSRTKISVVSTKAGVDAKGACVGKDGERIKRINDLLGGEKIDIFVWSDDPVQLIAEALLPAHVFNVTIVDEVGHKAMAIVDDAQYSLAIGTKGQNVTLAAKATGWHIDIKRMSEALQSGIQFTHNVKEIK